MRIRIETGNAEAFARKLERAARSRLEHASGETGTGPRRPPSRAALRPWPAPGEPEQP